MRKESAGTNNNHYKIRKLIKKNEKHGIKLIVESAEFTSNTGKILFRSSTVIGKVGQIAGCATSVLFLPFDIITLVKNSIEIHKDSLPSAIEYLHLKIEEEIKSLELKKDMCK